MTKEELVRHFHEKYNYPVDHQIDITDERALFYKTIGEVLIAISKTMEEQACTDQNEGNPLFYRIHLLTEELGEMIVALSDKDPVGILDALGDLQYVLSGFFVTFGVPIDDVFNIIHKSNMTKQHPKTGGGDRMRSKGDDFISPVYELQTLLKGLRNLGCALMKEDK